MESITHRTHIAESAIRLLRYGINSEHQQKIENAINEIGDHFNWLDLEVIKMEWDELIEQSKNL